MIQATLQIKTSSHRALRKKTLALIKDSSGKPILLCSLTPRSKKRNEGAKSHTFKESGTDLELAITEEITTSDRLFLELYLNSTSDRVWKLDQEKMLTAAETGHTIAQLREFLIAKSGEALPQPVEQFLVDLEERTQSVKSQGTALLLECANPALAALIANDSRTKKFCVLAGDRHLMVPLETETKFRTALRKLGYSLPR